MGNQIITMNVTGTLVVMDTPIILMTNIAIMHTIVHVAIRIHIFLLLVTDTATVVNLVVVGTAAITNQIITIATTRDTMAVVAVDMVMMSTIMHFTVLAHIATTVMVATQTTAITETIIFIAPMVDTPTAAALTKRIDVMIFFSCVNVGS